MKRYPLILIWFGLWIVAPLALIRMAWAILTNPERAWKLRNWVNFLQEMFDEFVVP